MISSRSRYVSEYRKYQRTHRRMITSSKCRPRNSAGRFRVTINRTKSGCSRLQHSRFYDHNTGKIDFDRLKYSPEMPIWVWPLQGLSRKPDWPRGGLYLDGDGDGIFNRERDYAFWVDV